MIQKGEVYYVFREIEFYLYNDHHRDIITYPRNSEGGQWFFHASGVDLTFKSNINKWGKTEKSRVLKPILDSQSSFGGILIRGIQKVNSDVSYTLDDPISGPLKVLNELFDQMGAFRLPNNFPVLVPIKHKLGKATLHTVNNGERHNLPPSRKSEPIEVRASRKAANIIKYNFADLDEEINYADLVDSFIDFLNAPYRYQLK